MSDPFEAARLKLKPKITLKAFRVFVFGPALQITQTVEEPNIDIATHADVETHARYLRHVTRLELEQLGFSVDYGESPQVLQFWQENFLAPDLATVEVNHAERMCGAIVVYPSSVGSICELGLFASREWLCRKTKAIIHKTYEDAPSFFRQGLLEYFDQEGGKPVHPRSACLDVAVKFHG
jgi:hypothetical protein